MVEAFEAGELALTGVAVAAADVPLGPTGWTADDEAAVMALLRRRVSARRRARDG